MAPEPKKKVTKKKSTTKKKAAAKKAPAKKAPVKKAPAKRKTARSASPLQDKIKVTREQRHKMICEAAYYISLERTYETVNPEEDWLKAESAIDQICVLNE